VIEEIVPVDLSGRASSAICFSSLKLAAHALDLEVREHGIDRRAASGSPEKQLRRRVAVRACNMRDERERDADRELDHDRFEPGELPGSPASLRCDDRLDGDDHLLDRAELADLCLVEREPGLLFDLHREIDRVEAVELEILDEA